MMNIAFDFDQAVFVAAIDGSAITSDEKLTIWIKHPLVYLYSYPALSLQALGLSSFFTVWLLCMISLVVALAFVWRSAMLLTDNRLVAVLITTMLCVTPSFISISIVFDSYTLLAPWNAACIYIYIKEQVLRESVPVSIKVIIYTMLIGVTAYMLVLVLILELNSLNQYRLVGKFKSALQRLLLIAFWSIVTACFLGLLVYQSEFVEMLTSPIDYARKILWAVNRPSEASSIFNVFYVLFFNALSAPHYSLVTIADGFDMFDLRTMQYSLVSLLLIAIFYLISFVSLANRKLVSVVYPMALFLVLSFVFHIEYHDRGSVFLYTSHFLFPLFVVFASALQNMKMRSPILVFALAFVSINLVTSFNMVVDLVQHVSSV
jgi:hypothetical protein